MPLNIQISSFGMGVDHAPLLTAQEQARADQMTEARRRAFVAGRRLARQMLGTALRINPLDVALVLKPSGRVMAPDGYFLSISHTGEGLAGYVGVAIAQEPIGLDVENPARDVDWRRLADRRLHPDETRAIARMTDAEGRTAFFRLWTGKEALVKLTDGQLLAMLKTCSADHASDQQTVMLDSGSKASITTRVDGPSRLILSVVRHGTKPFDLVPADTPYALSAYSG